MEVWVHYGIITIIIYSIWELLWEFVMKHHDACWCTSLITIISGGIISFIVLFFHIQEKGHQYGKAMSSITWFWLFIMGIFMVSINYFYSNSIKNGKNIGIVSCFTSSYILIVFLISGYVNKTEITIENLFGILMILVGMYFIQK